MNGNLNSDNFQYRLNQTSRDDALRVAENHRLVQIATDATTRRSRFSWMRQWFRQSNSIRLGNRQSRHGLRRLLHLPTFLAVVIAIALVTSIPKAAYAQEQAGARNDPGTPEIYHPAFVVFRVGYYYQIKGDQELAIAKFTEAIDLLPNYAYAFAARGDSYALSGNYQAAIEDYTIAIGIYPDYVSALTTRGNAYAMLEQYDLALADFTNAIMQMPEYAPAYRAAGDVHYLMGEIDAALNDYQSYVNYLNGQPDPIIAARIGSAEAQVQGS